MALATTLTSPTRQSQTVTDLGFAYRFAAVEARQELHDSFVIIEAALPFLARMGSIDGSGSTTIRTEHVGGMGLQQSMTSIGETDAAPLANLRAGVAALVVGMFGLAYAQTILQSIAGRQPAVDLMNVIRQAPLNVQATVRTNVATQGAAITNATGAAGTNLSVDNVLSFMSAARQAYASGLLSGLIHSVQWDQLEQSIRQEPGYQNSAMDFERSQRDRFGTNILQGLLGQNINLGITDDVNTSGGAYQGFAGDPGSVMWGLGNPARAPFAPGDLIAMFPELGMIVLRNRTSQTNQQLRADIFAALGFALNNAESSFQRRLISTT